MNAIWPRFFVACVLTANKSLDPTTRACGARGGSVRSLGKRKRTMNPKDFAMALPQFQHLAKPAPPLARAKALFDELNYRLAISHQKVTADQELQIIATVGGQNIFVRRLGILEGDIVTLETYHASGFAVMVAPIEQIALTILMQKKEVEQPRRFMGFSTAPHEDKRA